MNRHMLGVQRPVARQGATLTEVLMSMLIMGLGITSVFTLFPMSILRSVKSTNLTHAALLAETAREVYVYQKDTLDDPPARTLGANSYYAHGRDGFLDLAPAVADIDIPEPFVGTYVVDPLGGVNATPFGRQPGRFGDVLRVQNGMPVGLPTSPDSWVTAFEEIPVSIANTTIMGVDYAEISFLPQTDLTASITGNSRVLVVSDDNRQSFVTGLHATSTPTPNTVRLNRTLPLDLFDPTAGAPLGPPAGRVGLVRIQNFERRYSYLMTMHRDELGQTRGQLAVFFRREYGDSEQTFDLDPNLPNDRTIINKRLRTVRVNLGAGFTGRSPSPGEYIFGTWLAKPGNPVVHGRWYRIVAVSELGANYNQLTLDRAWEGLTDAGNDPRIMLPGGVISVFDL